ncbi:MAG: DUF2318 domain-containing protein [Acidobacteria bacterium]|nr:DUF2318 domain-containing protein [Acidobacteriota bacterium]
MKRRARKLELTRREKLSLLPFLVLMLVAVVGMVWSHQEQMTDRAEVVSVPAGEDADVPIARLDKQPALYLDFERLPEPHRLLVVRQPQGHIQTVFSVCRRCWSHGKPSRYLAGRLVCGHCREGMPMPGPGQRLPKEKDCTPVPVAAQTTEGILRIRHGDLLPAALEFRSGE